jgi:hypothetical protein
VRRAPRKATAQDVFVAATAVAHALGEEWLEAAVEGAPRERAGAAADGAAAGMAGAFDAESRGRR